MRQKTTFETGLTILLQKAPTPTPETPPIGSKKPHHRPVEPRDIKNSPPIPVFSAGGQCWLVQQCRTTTGHNTAEQASRGNHVVEADAGVGVGYHPGLAAAEAHHGLSGVAQSAGEKQPQPSDELQGQQPGKKNLRKDTLPGEGIFHVGRLQLRDQGG